MITDPTVFDEDHLPRQLRHRDAEADHLSRALQPAVDGARAEDVLLTGPSGVGKTVLSRVALTHLAETAPIDTVHLRCLGLTEGDMLQGVLEELGADASSWLLTDLRADLERIVDRPTIVVLDEADGLLDTGMIHHLTGIPKLSLVAICHDAPGGGPVSTRPTAAALRVSIRSASSATRSTSLRTSSRGGPIRVSSLAPSIATSSSGSLIRLRASPATGSKPFGVRRSDLRDEYNMGYCECTTTS